MFEVLDNYCKKLFVILVKVIFEMVWFGKDEVDEDEGCGNVVFFEECGFGGLIDVIGKWFIFILLLL